MTISECLRGGGGSDTNVYYVITHLKKRNCLTFVITSMIIVTITFNYFCAI